MKLLTQDVTIGELCVAQYFAGWGGRNMKYLWNNYAELLSEPDRPHIPAIHALTLHGLRERIRGMALTLCCFKHEKPLDEGGYLYEFCPLRMKNLGCGHGEVPLLPLRLGLILAYEQGIITFEEYAPIMDKLSHANLALWVYDGKAGLRYRMYWEDPEYKATEVAKISEWQEQEWMKLIEIRDKVVAYLDIILAILPYPSGTPSSSEKLLTLSSASSI